MGHALNSGGGWTGDLVIAGCHDIGNNVARSSRPKDSSQRSWIQEIAENIGLSLRRWFPETRRSRTRSALTPPESRGLRRERSTLYFGSGEE